MFDKNNLCSLFLGFILGYSINYYNKKCLKDIIDRLELFETKHLFLKEDINDLKLKIFFNKGLIDELNGKQESLNLMKKDKKKRNKIEVQYEDVDFGIHTPQ